MNKNIESMAKKIEELMAGGMSLADALAQAQPVAPTSTRTVIADRVSWISALERIDELKKAVKIAFAKKSKAKGNAETEAKYQREIDAGRARLNDLILEVKTATVPYIKALELGEDVSGVLQLYIESKEAGLEDKVKELTAGLTVAARKDLIGSQPATTPWGIRAELLELGSNYLLTATQDEFLTQYEGRAAKGDQRIIVLNKRYGFVENNYLLATPTESVEEGVETLEDILNEELTDIREPRMIELTTDLTEDGQVLGLEDITKELTDSLPPEEASELLGAVYDSIIEDLDSQEAPKKKTKKGKK